MASLLSMTEGGKTVELAEVGSDGLLGLPAVFGDGLSPYQVVVQLPGLAFKVSRSRLRAEFDGGGGLRDLLLRHTLWLLTQISQSAACHRFHSIEERLARLLLVSHDYAGSDTFNLTQESLSNMLGVPRTTVTKAAVFMQGSGLIRYKRGRIVILNGTSLQAISCECYRLIKREKARLFAA